MRKLVVNLFLLFVCNQFSAQTDLKEYSWQVAKNANPDTIFSISFERERLDSVPMDLMKFINLKKLNLSKNRLTDLPNEFKQLSKLEELHLGKNNLIRFPTEICHLKELKRLILNRNAFESIPECIENLTQLEILDLWATPVGDFPIELTTLKKLKLLDARGIMHGPKFQKKWQDQLNWVKIEFDSPCDCFE